MNTRRQAYWMLALAMASVGSTVIASKWIGISLPPFTATAIRFAIAAPLLFLLLKMTRMQIVLPGWRDALLLITQAAAGSAGYTVFLISGSTRTSAANAGIILGSLPAVAACVSSLLLRERMAPAMKWAILLATLGVMTVSVSGVSTEGGGTNASLSGDMLILFAVLSESLFILLNRKLQRPVPPLLLAFFMSALGLLICLPFAIGECLTSHIVWQAASLWACAYYALVPTVLGFWLWYSGSEKLGAHEASLMTSIAPVSAVLLSVLLMHESISAAQMSGLALILVAIWVGR